MGLSYDVILQKKIMLKNQHRHNKQSEREVDETMGDDWKRKKSFMLPQVQKND